MKLYLTHASSYDYEVELYEPLKKSLAKENDIFFPHDEHEEGVASKDIISTCDAVIAEVSYPSTGQGIELGWADAHDIPIICLYREDAKPSGALQYISNNLVEYHSSEDMIEKLRVEINNL